jgi:serine phosphatase RsbU (regulator of sigma subunit)
MSLRLRLIVAFFLLSVVPLAAVTIYTYLNNARALREAAEREADLLAGELGQRMQLVTAQLGERVEHLMDIAELQAAADEATAQAAQAARRAETTAPAAEVDLSDMMARSLGEAAMLLNNVELEGLRSLRGRRPPPAPGSRAGSAGATSGRGAGQSRADVSSGGSRSTRSGSGAKAPVPAPAPPGVPPPGAPAVPPTAPIVPPPVPPPAAGAPPVPGSSAPPPMVTVVTPEGADRLRIDMAPIRRELLRQIVPEGTLESLSPAERQRLAAEINQRMLGIVQGIRVGAAELEKRAAEAERAASAQARVREQQRRTQAQAAANLKRSTSLSGSTIGVKVERDGKVVRQVHAELNLPNVLATAFSTTQRDGGEIPFAISRDGRIYTRTDGDRGRVESFGAVARHDGPATARLPDWIVVTTMDTSGSGLKLGIARPVGDSLASLRRVAARNAGFGLLFIGVALVGIVPLSGHLTRNLTRLNDGVRRIASGDYGARVPLKGRDEIGRLAAAFNQMAADVERHQRAAVEQERIKRELELGRQIQNEMLPHAPLRLGMTEIKGVSVPAREVGGDFFNYFELRNGHIAMLVGDVSGKGVGAALLMANIQASLRTRLALGQDLSAIADEIDRDIEASSPGPVYATLFVGIFDPVSRRLRYVNAGHHPQFVLRRGGPLERMPATGLPVGLFAGRGYGEGTLQLDSGDVIFFYTDGCVEMENDAEDMFGSERLESLLVAAPAGTADDLLSRVESAVKSFRGLREPFDDATMMAVKVG